MSTAIAERKYTPEDLLSIPDGDRFELVDGRLVEKKVGALSDGIAAYIIYFLIDALRRGRMGGRVFGETGYQCFGDDRQKVRKPDVSFIRRGRLAGQRIPEGHILIPPDLAVEVVSPNDLFYEVGAKVAEYLAAGVGLIWVVDPRTRVVYVYGADGSTRLTEADELTAGELIPGFRCAVADIFAQADV